jgi:hypothetical protein
MTIVNRQWSIEGLQRRLQIVNGPLTICNDDCVFGIHAKKSAGRNLLILWSSRQVPARKRGIWLAAASRVCGDLPGITPLIFDHTSAIAIGHIACSY